MNEVDESFEQELRDELNRLAQNNKQPTKDAWEAIMEEAKTQSRSARSRVRILSIAATVVVIVAAVSATVLVANGGKDSKVKTVNHRHKDRKETVSTKPLTPEESLLKNSYLVRKSGATYELIDPSTNETVENLMTITSSSSQGSECNFVNINRKSTENLLGLDKENKTFRDDSKFMSDNTFDILETRTWSPDGSQYADIKKDCRDGAFMIVVNAKTGASRTIKGHQLKHDSTDSMETVAMVDRAIWVDNNRILVEISFGGESGNWSIIDLRQSIDLLKVAHISVDHACCDSSGYGNFVDVRDVNGQIYILATYHYGHDDNGESLGADELRVVSGSDGHVIWSKAIPNDDFVAQASFGKDTNEVFGSLASKNKLITSFDDYKAFGFDRVSDTLITPIGTVLSPR
jgi:hypothetical protein